MCVCQTRQVACPGRDDGRCTILCVGIAGVMHVSDVRAASLFVRLSLSLFLIHDIAAVFDVD